MHHDLHHPMVYTSYKKYDVKVMLLDQSGIPDTPSILIYKKNNQFSNYFKQDLIPVRIDAPVAEDFANLSNVFVSVRLFTIAR